MSMSDSHSNAYAYVVGVLSPAEAHDFERHLVECGQCAEELVDARTVASALSSTVATAPPARLRTSVLDVISRTAQEQLAPASAARPALLSAVATTAKSSPSADSNVVPMRRSWSSRGSSLLVAAAVIAALAFGGWALQATQEAREARQVAEAAALDAREARQDAEAAAKQQDKLTNLLSANDVRAVSGRSPVGDLTGTVVMSEQRRTAVLVASELPELPEGRVYEAWTMKGEDPTPAGIFAPDGSDAVVELTDETFDADSVAVTQEPAGGSEQPTTDPIFTVLLPQR